MNAQSLRADVGARLEGARTALDTFLGLPPETSPSDVLAAFDAIGRPLNAPLGLFVHTHPEAEVRAAARELEQQLSRFSTDLSLNRAAWERLAALDADALADPEERRLLEHALRDYRRSGVSADDATRERIRGLIEELVLIGQEFQKNIASDTRELRIPEGHAALKGLPADFLAAHPEAADGSVTVTTDPPDMIPFMTFCEREDLRRELALLASNRAWPANDEVLRELLAKRYELSRLLGYEHWAAYATEDKMIETPEHARAFIERLRSSSRPRAEAELAELSEMKASLGGDPNVHAWDRAFLSEKVKNAKFGFDSQAVRPYFAYEGVRDGVLATSAKLYGVAFERNRSVPVWHDSVECYDVVDPHGEDGRTVVARFFLDMHPRPDKFKHAAMFDSRRGIAGECIPEACLVCNFPRPTRDDAALLLHGQVTTFFHEFGHLLHHLFSTRRFLSFAGIACEWDFVEVPSQIYEEWAWDAGVLQHFARHVDSGEPIPAELVETLRAAEEYGKGLQVGTQMFYAALSLSFYDRDPAQLDPTRHMLELSRELAPIPIEEGSHFQASFGHLHGYSALYYTYAWSEVIAKDVFSRFDGDLMNGATANEYRARVLAQGGSKDAAELVRDFLGRDYSYDAYEAWLAR